MRRIGLAVAALAVIAVIAVLLVARYGLPFGPGAILRAAARAMQDAKILHHVVHGMAPVPDSSGDFPVATVTEAWVSDRAKCSRVTRGGGTLLRAEALNAETGEWWYYDGNRQKRFVGDLKSVPPKGDEVICEFLRMARRSLVSMIMDVPGVTERDAEKSVTLEQRDGREVAVVTISYTERREHPAVTHRTVFEVDTGSKHLMSIRRHVKAGDKQDRPVVRVSNVEYDVPMRCKPADLGVPEGTESVQTKTGFDANRRSLSVVMKAGDFEHRLMVPRTAD